MLKQFAFLAAASLAALGITSPSIAQDNLVTGDDINTVNTGTPSTDDGEITYTIARDIVDWNVTSARGNNPVVRSINLPIVATAFRTRPDFTFELNSDLLVSAEITGTDPQVVVYTIREEAVWNDGTPITGDDFIYIWQTHNGRDCTGCLINARDGYDLVEAIDQDETGKVVTVTFNTPYVAWQGLFMFMYPAHLAAQHGSLEESYNGFLSTEMPTWSAGPYQVDSFDPGQLVTLVPNPNWYGEETPHLSRLMFRIITDPSQHMTALENGEVDVIYPQGATQDTVQQAQELSYLDIVYQANPSANWHFVGLNLDDPALADITLRKAILTAIDVADIKAKTIDPFLDSWTRMESVMFLPSQLGYEPVTQSLGHGSGEVEAALSLLTEAGYKLEGERLIDPSGAVVPPLKLVYPTGVPIFDDFAVLIGNYLREIGIGTEVITGPNTTAEYVLKGNYSLMLNYYSQTVYPATKAEQIWTTDAPQNYGRYSNSEVDDLIERSQAAPTAEESATLLQRADRIIQEHAHQLPLFQVPTALIYRSHIVNLRDNPNQIGPLYNAGEWGVNR
jgi:peptide/nickel transport system substrate-binding protein